MHGLLVICLAATALAAPQGYNYNQPQGSHFGSSQNFGGSHSSSHGFSSGFGSSGSHGGSSGGSGFGVGGGSSFGGSGGSSFGGGGGSSFGGSGGSSFGGSGGSSFGGSGIGFGSGSSAGSHHSHHGQHHDQAPIVSKNFYIHSAPEEAEEEGQHKEISLGPARKSYRVVFIKAPAQSSKSAAISLSQPQHEEKTVIYVLSKKTDASDIQTNIKEAPHTETKPEVFFIKYKTPEEAAHAQQQIQAQYDSLGGTSHVSDEGVAPISSVIGALGSGHGGQGHGGQGHGGQGHGGHSAGGGSSFGSFGGSSGGSGSFSGGSSSASSGTYLPPSF